MLRRFRWGQRDDGASAVEFALIVPVLMMLVFGIINFGIVFAQQLSLSNGARQGSRFGVVDQNTCGDIVSQAQSGAATIGMSASDVAVRVQLNHAGSPTTLCDWTTSATGGSSSVKPCSGSQVDDTLVVTTKFTSKLTIPLVIYNPNLVLNGQGVFRCEFS